MTIVAPLTPMQIAGITTLCVVLVAVIVVAAVKKIKEKVLFSFAILLLALGGLGVSWKLVEHKGPYEWNKFENEEQALIIVSSISIGVSVVAFGLAGWRTAHKNKK